LTPEDVDALEAEVNEHIRRNQPVTTRLMPPEQAIAAGAMALFGEKYGDEVRVLSMGSGADAPYSVELCGGTHVAALGDIQLFKIVSESAVAAGVRRIEALTGEAARRWLTGRDERLREAVRQTRAAAGPDAALRVLEIDPDSRVPERRVVLTPFDAAPARRPPAGPGVSG
jgi:alanyl-tRNA synthetase